MTEHDKTSYISLPPRTVPVDYGDSGAPDGDGVDGVQASLSLRSTEAAAIDAILHPDDPAHMDEDEFEAYMLARGFVRCMGRCKGAFKHKSEFSPDERNTGRLNCQSVCKKCAAIMAHRKRAATRQTEALIRYEYRQRRGKKKAKQKRAIG